MAVLSVQNLKMEFGERVLFDSVNFEVGEREKIGFIGSNASGKTTLFKLIIGELEPSDGEIFKGKNINIGYLEQHACANSTKTVYDEAESVFESLAEAERRIEELSDMMNSGAGDIDSLIAQQQRLQAEFENGGGLTYKSRTRSMLTGLGFAQEDFSLECSKLSGGQRSKLALGKLLLSEPDLILLDEPTNHIDLLSLEWLENFLKDFKGSAIIISHDRYFLDNVTTKTMHLDHERLTVWNGGYSRFLEQKTERDEIERRHYERQMDEVHRLEGIIEQQKRWRHYITAESKQKMLDKKLAEVTAPQNENKTLGFSFGEVSSTGNEVLNVFGLSKSFGENHLFKGVEFGIRKGDRAFLLGANGCGKTTLLKLISRQILPCYGNISVDGENIADLSRIDFAKKISLLPQERYKVSISVYNYISTGRYPYHGTFGKYGKEDVDIILDSADKVGVSQFIDKDIRLLSGGERQKVYIATVLAQDTPYILLDEPTTFLDVSAKFEIMSLLKKISAEGKGVIAVLHDISLAMKYCDELLVISRDSFFGDLFTPISAFENGIIREIFNVKCTAMNIDGKTEYLISENS